MRRVAPGGDGPRRPGHERVQISVPTPLAVVVAWTPASPSCGDHKHRHSVAPTDLGLSVRLANAVAASSPLSFVPMPVDRENGHAEAYFAPLREPAVGDAELALGVIDYENDAARIDELVAAASSAPQPFSVTTECGMSRLGERGEAVTLQSRLDGRGDEVLDTLRSTLKAVLHRGQAVRQAVGAGSDLLGPAVTVAHRLLKNTVRDRIGFRPYLLVTDAAATALGLAGAGIAHRGESPDGGWIDGRIIELDSPTREGVPTHVPGQ